MIPDAISGDSQTAQRYLTWLFTSKSADKKLIRPIMMPETSVNPLLMATLRKSSLAQVILTKIKQHFEHIGISTFCQILAQQKQPSGQSYNHSVMTYTSLHNPGLFVDCLNLLAEKIDGINPDDIKTLFCQEHKDTYSVMYNIKNHPEAYNATLDFFYQHRKTLTAQVIVHILSKAADAKCTLQLWALHRPQQFVRLIDWLLSQKVTINQLPPECFSQLIPKLTAECIHCIHSNNWLKTELNNATFELLYKNLEHLTERIKIKIIRNNSRLFKLFINKVKDKSNSHDYILGVLFKDRSQSIVQESIFTQNNPDGQKNKSKLNGHHMRV